jgi:outer membrane protein assembly factor BamB
MLLICVGCLGCNKEDVSSIERTTEGVITSLPYQWKTPLSFGTSDRAWRYSIVRDDITLGGDVIMSKQGVAGSSLVMLEGESGAILWEWEDWFGEETDREINLDHTDVLGNILFFSTGKRFYGVDISNGSTFTRQRLDYYINHISGQDDRLYLSANVEDDNIGFRVDVVRVLNFPELRELKAIIPPYAMQVGDANNITGYLNTAIPITNNEIAVNSLIGFSYGDALESGRIDVYYAAYALSADTFVYTEAVVALNTKGGIGGRDVYADGKIYTAPNHDLVCLDSKTGKKLWTKDFGNGFSFSGYIYVNGKILANNENTYLYALDPNTGQELWREKSSGTSSYMSVLNGVVYFVGGGDGLLHAVDIETGKHLWKIRSPDLDINSGAWFARRVSVIPPEDPTDGTKGKVVVGSYLSAFCYEAARSRTCNVSQTLVVGVLAYPKINQPKPPPIKQPQITQLQIRDYQ